MNDKTIEQNAAEETVPEKAYIFRKLNSTDTFLMFKIIGKIGVNEFTACFEKEALQKMLARVTGGNTEESGNENTTTVMGISVILEIANVIMNNVPKCEAEIYEMLSNTSNLTVDEVKGLDFATFASMVVDFIKKDEFKDFIKVVSGFFK